MLRFSPNTTWLKNSVYLRRRSSTNIKTSFSTTTSQTTPSHPLPRESFDPIATEAGRYQWWNENRLFQPSTKKDDQSTFSMILPPPNVTGVLHVGHALTVALQDSLARWRRMRGDRVLWIPGLDHAGIATQSVVEKRLLSESGVTRHDLGREEFLKHVWDWRNKHGHRIVEQLQGMGASLAWEQEFFTLDEIRSKAVIEAFVQLHNEGLIYRRRRHVNWCCALRTAISDIEVDRVQINSNGEKLGPIPGHDPLKKYEFGTLVQFAYPICDNNGIENGDELIVATTRLETMLGDVAIAVHSNDQRYEHLHGMFCVHPFRNEKHPLKYMPIVLDDILVDPQVGTGAVKITPAHDPEDYSCATRVTEHQLPLNWNVFDSGGCITSSCSYNTQIPKGMPRYEAREKVELLLREYDLFRSPLPPTDDDDDVSDDKQKKEDAKHVVVLPRCSRSGDVVEPRLLPQWYVRTTDPSLSTEAAHMGRSMIEGERHIKEWSRWLSDDVAQDWCVSRQLWWGHRIPAWKITNLKYETEKGFNVMDGIEKDSWLHQTLLETDNHDNKQQTNKKIGNVVDDDDEDDSEQWIVARNEKDARQIALEKIWKSTANLNVPISWHFDMEQDEDVLDTWFSSALLPLSSLEWPLNDKDNKHLSSFYPLSLMETGSDILFFWVARMAMLCSFLDKINNNNINRPPFKKVLLHPMVRDKRGRKMSKSLGNVIDPLDVTKGTTLENLISTLSLNSNMSIDEKKTSIKDIKKQYPNGIQECGVDGLRFALCSYLEGSDMSGTINLDVQRAVSARHMCNKLWNASKFILSSDNSASSSSTPFLQIVPTGEKDAHRLIDRWILSRVANTVKSVNENMDAFRLGNVTSLLRNHLIHDLCDVYIELSKKDMNHQPNETTKIVQNTLYTVLLTYLKLLHPIMPFVTEEIYQAMIPNDDGNNKENVNSIMNAPYPIFQNEWDQWLDDSVENDFNNIIFEPAKAIRSLRKLAADTFGKDIAEDMYVNLFVDCNEEHVNNDTSSLLNKIMSNVDHVRQLCRHQAVDIVDGKDVQLNQDNAPSLSRTLVLPYNSNVIIRIYLPKLSGSDDMENAREKISKELNRLRKKKKKVNKQLEKLVTLTSRSTYLETAPKEVQELQHVKINELKADAEDIDHVTNILNEFDR
jgi:valyl-tRNA synthetase